MRSSYDGGCEARQATADRDTAIVVNEVEQRLVNEPLIVRACENRAGGMNARQAVQHRLIPAQYRAAMDLVIYLWEIAETE